MKNKSKLTWSVIVVAVAILLLQKGTTEPTPSDGTPVSFEGSYIVFIDESGERSAQLADMLGSAKARKRLSDVTDGWRHWDKDTDMANAQKELAELFGLFEAPCVALAADGEARRADIPENLDALLNLLDGWEK